MSNRQQSGKFILVVILCLLLSYLAILDSFETVENRLQDKVLQHRSPMDTQIVLIAIDDASLQELGRLPWSRDVHARLLNILSEGEPAVVGFDLIFNEPAANRAEDQALVEAIQKVGKVVLPVYAGLSGRTAGDGPIRTKELNKPFKQLEQHSLTGHINTFPDPDGIVRKTALYLDYRGENIPSFAWQIYQQYCRTHGLEGLDLMQVPLDPIMRMEIAFSGEPGDIEHVSYIQVLNGQVPPEFFSGRIVLVGPYTVGIDDYYFTPLAPEVPMYGIEVHGNIIQNLLQGNIKERVNYPLVIVLMVICSLIALLAFNRLNPQKGLIVLVVAVAAYLGLAKLIYSRNLIIPLFYPLLFLILTYLISLAINYLTERLERRRITGVFSRYVAPQVVDKLLEGGEKALRLGGARREISVLFVDIRGFTPLSEAAAPEEVVEILNEYLTLVAEAIFRYGGTLDKFIGDAAMAIFNAPLDLADHYYQAVQAAWAMKEGSYALQQKLQEKYGRNVQFGIGINCGQAVIGNIGADFRMDYTAIGDTVNTAARLESNAKPGQILLSQAIYEQVSDRVKVTALGEIKVKGKEQGINIYQLDGLKV